MNTLPKSYSKNWDKWTEFFHTHNVDWTTPVMKVRTRLYYPSPLGEVGRVFFAFKKIDPDDVKVIIVGQDPYPTKGLATGVAFEIPERARMTPSLDIIYDEMDLSLGTTVERKKDLTYLIDQGVLLLNSALTCAPNSPGSHASIWRSFVRQFIYAFTMQRAVVVSPWGNVAQTVCGTKAKSYVMPRMSSQRIDAPHPMKDKYSGGNFFRGSNVFIKVNQALEYLNYEPIEWGKPNYSQVGGIQSTALFSEESSLPF